MSTHDTWSALFAVWHKQEHEREAVRDLKELEERIVKLEARLRALTRPRMKLYDEGFLEGRESMNDPDI